MGAITNMAFPTLEIRRVTFYGEGRIRTSVEIYCKKCLSRRQGHAIRSLLRMRVPGITLHSSGVSGSCIIPFVSMQPWAGQRHFS